MSINTSNLVSLTGRLARDPKIWDQANGAKSYAMTIMVKDNFQSTRNGKKDYHSQGIDVRGYASAERGLGIVSHLKQGDEIQVGASLAAESYEKDGKTVYTQTVRVETVTPLAKGPASRSGNQAADAEPIQAPQAKVADETEGPF